MTDVDETIADTLIRMGVGREAVDRWIEHGDPYGALLESVLMPDREERTVSLAEVERRGCFSVQDIEVFARALGIRTDDPEAPVITESEAELFLAFHALEEVWTPDAREQLARVYGRLMARIARAEVQTFRTELEALGVGNDEQAVVARLHAVREAVEKLAPLADSAIILMHRRWLERAIGEAAVSFVEDELQGQMPGRVEVAILFCDLKGFTQLTQVEGDLAAMEAVDGLTGVLQRASRPTTLLTKSVGDGFLVVLPDAASAVEVACEVIRQMDEEGHPAVHAAVHFGPAIARDGDYFGNSVNVASRLLALAGPNELVVTDAVVDKTSPELPWRRVLRVRLPGQRTGQGVPHQAAENVSDR